MRNSLRGSRGPNWEAGGLRAADDARGASALHEVGEAGAHSFVVTMAVSTA